MTEITTGMEKCLLCLHNKETDQNFWNKERIVELSKESYNYPGMLITDVQRLTGCTYKTIHNSIIKLRDLDYVMQLTKGRNYVLTSRGTEKVKLLIKYRKVDST